MKLHAWDTIGTGKGPVRRRVVRRKSVAAILRAAYRRFAGDAVTRRAVKRCLP